MAFISFLITRSLPGKFACHVIFEHAEIFMLSPPNLFSLCSSLVAGDSRGAADGGVPNPLY